MLEFDELRQLLQKKTTHTLIGKSDLKQNKTYPHTTNPNKS